MSLPPSTEDVFQETYEELRRLAARELRKERSDHTLQPTALVHEAYFRLSKKGQPWNDREHFLLLAARVMRQVLVDWARGRAKEKRGGEKQVRITLDDEAMREGQPVRPNSTEILHFDEALSRLERYDSRKASILELRAFAGLTIGETAAAVGVSEATVIREWRAAKAWVARFLQEVPNPAAEAKGFSLS